MATLRTTRFGTNPSQQGLKENPTKAKNASKAVGGQGLRPLTRSALGDIANRPNNAKSDNGGLKDDLKKIVKPVRGLTKQKAVADLSKGRTTRSKKSASPVPNDDTPMETDLEQDEKVDLDVDMEEMETESAAQGQVEDIDADDRENPQMATDYVNEIYAYMRQLESEQSIRQNYLESVQGKTVIKPKMRNLLVDWMVEVHSQFSLLQETLYLSVAVLDRYLQKQASVLSTKQLQLVGVSSMLLAAKYEEMYPPEIADFVYITDQAYTEAQIRKMEIAIFAALDFDLGRPLPLNFLRRNSKAGFVDATVHTLAKYVMELSIVEYKLCHVAPSKLAAASLAFSIMVLDPLGTAKLSDLWTQTLVHYTSYKIKDFAHVLEALSAHVLQTSLDMASKGSSSSEAEKSSKSKKLRSVATKYGSKKLGMISMLPQLRSQLVQDLANGQF